MSQEIATQPREMSLLETVSAAARDPEVQVDKYERLLNIARQLESDKAKSEFFQALGRIQAEVPRVVKKGTIRVPAKDGKAGHQTPFALYEDIDAVLRPLMQTDGFGISFTSEPANGGAIWRGILSHRMGHSETYSTPPLPADQTGSKNALQAVFSASSYARRYLLCMIFNIVTVGQDDDGAATSFINDQQISTITDMLNACEIKAGSPDMGRFLDFAEADKVEHIQRRKYDDVMAQLRKRLAKKEGR